MKIGRGQALFFGVLLALSAACGVTAILDAATTEDRASAGMLGFLFMACAIGVLIADFSGDGNDGNDKKDKPA